MKIRKKIKGRFNTFYSFLIFLIAIAVVLAVYPKEGKFRYEFQKGKPWLHENISAPFDFVIYKAKQELESEKDSIVENFKPYFKLDKHIYFKTLGEFQHWFDQKWKEHIITYYRYDDDTSSINPKKQKIDELKKETYDFCVRILDYIYTKGVYDPVELKKHYSGATSFVLLRDNVAENIQTDELFTVESAGEYLAGIIQKQKENGSYSNIINFKFLDNLQLKKYLTPNIIVDLETSRKFKDNLLEGISITRGMVQEGQKIIKKGEIVSNEKYRILESLKKEYEASVGKKDNLYMLILGQFMLIFICFLVIYLFLFNFRKDILRNLQKTGFLLMLILLFMIITSITLKVNVLHHYLIPFALLPVIIRTFYDTRLALFIHMVTMLMIAFITPNAYEFVFLQFIAGAVAIFSLATIRKRSQLFITSLFIFLTYSFIYLGIVILQEGSLAQVYMKNFIWFGANSLLLLSAYPLIYVFEKIFGFLSDITLMELSDTNHPALRLLAEKAPGTFQHSLQVANLAEEVIYHLGGNALLIRVGAMYHDLGKVNAPYYFIENQRAGINPHDEIEFDESAEIIISHVSDGIKLAQKFNLPQQITDFIKTHHGNTKVQYFYRSFVKKYPDLEVDVEKFTYPGVSPFTKEQAVLMLADSVEAASRSLKDYTETSISQLVDKIIDYQINENQYADCDITFRDIAKAKDLLKNKLINIYHARIEYPEEKKSAN